MRRRIAVSCLMVVATAATVGCWTKERCMSEYSLVPEEDCIVGPPPGPPIILQPDPVAANNLTWNVNGNDQGDAGPLTVTLRHDFIGISTLTLQCEQPAGVFRDANLVTAENPAVKLEIHRTAIDTFRYTLTDKTTGSTVDLFPSGQANTGTVPTQFLNLQANTLTDETGPCLRVNIQATLPL